MQTAYDWVAIGIFAGLVLLFLHRSAAEEPPRDYLLQYIVASGGCALGNYLGNQGHDLLAIGVIVAVLAFIFIALAPLGRVI
jgi:hypothetical protein